MPCGSIWPAAAGCRSGVIAFLNTMCGIAGFLTSGWQRAGCRRAGDVRPDPPPRAGRRRHLHRRPLRHRHAPAQHHRPQHRPSAHLQRRRQRLGRLQRRDLQLPGTARRPDPHAATASAPTATPKPWSICTKKKAPTACTSCAACSPSASGTARKRKMLLARDRFGKKPLYYAQTPVGLLFRQRTEVPAAWRACRSISTTRRCGSTSSSATLPIPTALSRPIRKLMPGCWIEYSADGAMQAGPLLEAAAVLGRKPEWAAAKPRHANRFASCSTKSVRIRMIADVPLGAFLSGGIDSSLVVASMALQSSRAGEDVFHWLRRERLQRTEYARAGGEEIQDRPPRDRGAARFARR